MARVRAYLACFYLSSSFGSVWTKNYLLPYKQWTATCCDILESNVDGEAEMADQVLVWLVRLGHIAEQASYIIKGQGSIQHEDHHTLLVVKGMEAQLREWRARMSLDVSTKRKYPPTCLLPINP